MDTCVVIPLCDGTVFGLVQFWFFNGVGALARPMLNHVALGKPRLFFSLVNNSTDGAICRARGSS